MSNNYRGSNGHPAAAPSLSSFSFQKSAAQTAPQKDSDAGKGQYSDAGKGRLRFDLKKTSNAPPLQRTHKPHDWSKKANDDKMAMRKERFAQPQKKKVLYKPEKGMLDNKGVKEQSDFIGFGDLGLQEEEPEVDAHWKRRLPINDKDPLDLVYDLPPPIWAHDGREYSSDLTEMFNQEVQDYVHYISPTPAEHSLRHLTIERLRFVVSRLWPQATVEVFGSFSTKLYLPTSDVDIVIMGTGLRAPASLFELSVALKDHGYATACQVIAKAKVPIIKYTDALTTFPVDISINMPSGLQAAQIVSHFLQEPNGVGEAIRGLMYLLKQFLLARYLNEPFNGGCGSYALLLLVSSFVKLHPLIQLGTIDPSQNLGFLFMEFLELYGRFFNFDQIGISCDLNNGPEYFLKRDMPPMARKIGLLTLLDPQDSSNDVGGGAFNFYTIRGEFFRAFQRIQCIFGAAQHRNLHQSRRKSRRGNTTTPPKPPLSILSAILTVRKGLYAYRCGMEELWDKVQAGNVVLGVEAGVWEGVCEGMKRQEVEKRYMRHGKRKRDVAVVGEEEEKEAAVGSEEEEEEGAVHMGVPMRDVTGAREEVPYKKRQETEWKEWEREFFETLKEGKEELGYESEVSMEISDGEEEEGQIVSVAKKRRVGSDDEEEEGKGAGARNPLKKKARV
ncbi:hypothetical protein HDU98_006397 [Podochytrium sp. JEL0797]|nr:hypothetical protein HDU98_006397 [Podochytrium sp. JEL0797]